LLEFNPVGKKNTVQSAGPDYRYGSRYCVVGLSPGL
jgi:hypothetical protein